MIKITIRSDAVYPLVRITLNGPKDRWFGFIIIIGQGHAIMSGQAITLEPDMVERNSSHNNTLDWSEARTLINGELRFVRPYLVSNKGSSSAYYFDFTNSMTCNIKDIPIIGIRAQESSTSFDIHSSVNAASTFTRTCDCNTDTTESPIEDYNYEICEESGLIPNVALTLYRGSINKMINIQISGPNTQWFGYGSLLSKVSKISIQNTVCIWGCCEHQLLTL